jgi:hypothetical protein
VADADGVPVDVSDDEGVPVWVALAEPVPVTLADTDAVSDDVADTEPLAVTELLGVLVREDVPLLVALRVGVPVPLADAEPEPLGVPVVDDVGAAVLLEVAVGDGVADARTGASARPRSAPEPAAAVYTGAPPLAHARATRSSAYTRPLAVDTYATPAGVTASPTGERSSTRGTR